MRRRRAGPTRILGRLSPEERAGPASGLWRLHDAAGEEHAAETAGPPSL